jgi:hypothetical protein
MIFAVGKELNSFDSFVPVVGAPSPAPVMLLERSTDKSLTNVRYTLVAKVMRELKPIILGLVKTFTLEELEPFRIPCAPMRVSLWRGSQ